MATENIQLFQSASVLTLVSYTTAYCSCHEDVQFNSQGFKNKYFPNVPLVFCSIPIYCCRLYSWLKITSFQKCSIKKHRQEAIRSGTNSGVVWFIVVGILWFFHRKCSSTFVSTVLRRRSVSSPSFHQPFFFLFSTPLMLLASYNWFAATSCSSSSSVRE